MSQLGHFNPPSTPEQNMKTTIAKSAALMRKIAQLLTQHCVIVTARLIADQRPIYAQHIAGAALTNFECRLKVDHRLPLCRRRHHFFAPISLSIALSSMASANKHFSFAFSFDVPMCPQHMGCVSFQRPKSLRL